MLSCITAEASDKLMTELYRTVLPMYIFQGITADIVWMPEAVRAFRARVQMMVQEYASEFYLGSPYSEIVDRSICPKATSRPFALRWPKPASGAD